jgi:hypothetical protein
LRNTSKDMFIFLNSNGAQMTGHSRKRLRRYSDGY